jgi:hypothetical protein
MSIRLRKGQIVSIEFLDHCAGGSKPIVCRVYGKITSISKKHVEVITWETIGEDKATTLLNDERFIIVRSAIKQIFHLQEIKD